LNPPNDQPLKEFVISGQGCRRLKAILDEKRITYRYHEFSGLGHEMDVWRPSLIEFLSKLFKP
jgi:enterochelin esterase-like enzyme